MVDVSEKVTALYDTCDQIARQSAEHYKKVFTQAELLSLCTVPPLEDINDARTLLSLVEKLQNNKLFITLKANRSVCWSLRPRDDAARLKNLSTDESNIYTIIEEAHREGIWIRRIKGKTQIPDKTLDRILGRLQTLGLIKAVKNVKAPAQKTFMLAHLAPSDEVTGGSFYDGGELDESLVEELSNLIVFHVSKESWREERRKMKKEAADAVKVEPDVLEQDEHRGRAKKRKLPDVEAADIEDMANPTKKARRSHKHGRDPDYDPIIQLPYPAGHDYPTAASIHKYIISNDFIRPTKGNSLTPDEIQNVIDVLVWDGKLERVNFGYRTVRGVKPSLPNADNEEDLESEEPGNGLTEMPCGRCPVMDICGPGGPIDAGSCVYMKQWLGEDEGLGGLLTPYARTEVDLTA